MAVPESLTGQYLSKARSIPMPSERRAAVRGAVEVVGAAENNLQEIDVRFLIGLFNVVTGVSGSGKSTLVNDILAKAAAATLQDARGLPGRHREIRGLDLLDKVVNVDQSPIGRTPRSNPATYTGVFTEIRNLFAETKDAKVRGYRPGRFSFNVKGGRCEACEATAWCESRCTSCRTSSCAARSAAASATTVRRWRSATRAPRSPTCWR
jgi:excinuclease ABC subunit A